MGEDKANLQLGKRTMLEHVCGTLLTVVEQVVIVTSPEQPVDLTDHRVRVVVDDIPGEGPLGGFLTGLRSLVDGRAESPSAIWLSACDTPLIPASVIGKTCDQLQVAQADVVALSHEGRINPLIAAYHIQVLSAVEKAFDNGERSMMRVLSRLNYEAVDSGDFVEDSRLLMNINHPDDLAEARQLLDTISSKERQYRSPGCGERN